MPPMGGGHLVHRSVALALVVLAGGLCLAMPFWGDQALFTVYGRQLSEGAVLYRDVFDLKQPGIFAFYAAGGTLFGFTEVGIHAFELIYWLAFSAFALAVLRPHFRSGWAVSLVPVFTVGVYYLGARIIDLTQVEILVAFPLLVAWWLIDRGDPRTRWGLSLWAAAGAATAAVVLLKHLYLLIIVAFLVYAALRARRRGVETARTARGVAAFVAALLVPLLVVAIYFGTHGQLERIWWAYFDLAPRARFLDPEPVGHLTTGAGRFLVMHAPVVILAVVGSVRALREGQPRQLDLVVAMTLWIGLGTVALVIQFWGVWHWLLLTVPVGILAALGAEGIVSAARGHPTAHRVPLVLAAGVLGGTGFLIGTEAARMHRWAFVIVAVGIGAAIVTEMRAGRPRLRSASRSTLAAALAVSAGLAMVTPVNKVWTLMAHDLGTTTEAREAIRAAMYDSYRAADEDLDTLGSREGEPGSLYVFGDPVLLLRADRPQPVPIHGWGPEKLDGRAWGELHRDLREAAPSHIVVSAFAEAVISRRYPQLLSFLESEYDPTFVGSTGVWHTRR